jgi:hypothetical protein
MVAAMLSGYLNKNAEILLGRLPSEGHRAWVWAVIDELKKRYPGADHWTTGGPDKKYIDIRIGKKTKGKMRGTPVFYFKRDASMFVHRRSFRSGGKYEALTFENSSAPAQIQAWFDRHQIGDSILAALQGKSLRPADYSDADAEADEEDALDGDEDLLLPQPGNAQTLNRILYGPPGTGKTYRTVHEALSIIESSANPAGDYTAQKKRFDDLRKNGRIAFVTFHQSFSYEDFIEGIRAESAKGELSYNIRDGIFKKMAITAMYPDPASENEVLSEPAIGYEQKKQRVLAAERFAPNGKPYVLIIDEINRGNMSRVFGELITLIEGSKRAGRAEAVEVQLPYSNERFSVPDNLYIIGTMNTADRSLAVVDTALRRRFDFVEMMPSPDVLKIKDVAGVDLVRMLKTINLRIEHLYDREHTIGHSFFMSLTEKSTIADLAVIFKNNVLPLLEEYFYEDWEKIGKILGKSGIYDLQPAANPPRYTQLDSKPISRRVFRV